MADPTLPLDQGLFGRLRRDAGPAWTAYVTHPFLAALGAGTLPHAAYRHYLTQDYLFLVQFARAHALAAYKATDIADIRAAAATVTALVDVEMPLHLRTCAGWGLDQAALAATEEALETTAYTRFVLDRGLAGDLLDLHVALAPCIVGYADCAARLAADPATRRDGNPYTDWIDTYSGEPYRDVARTAIATLDRLSASHGGDARFPTLLATFTRATRLETAFWAMGWRAVSENQPGSEDREAVAATPRPDATAARPGPSRP